MRTILNLIWLVLSGFWLALAYAFAGLIMCVLIITIPFGVASFRLAAYVLWPFGRTVIRRPGAGAASMVGNVLWFLLAGVWIAIAHVVLGLILCLTIVGIPLGLGNLSWLRSPSHRSAKRSSLQRPPRPRSEPSRFDRRAVFDGWVRSWLVLARPTATMTMSR